MSTLTSKSLAKEHPTPSGLGLLVVDSSLSPIYFNAEALQALTYPEVLRDLSSVHRLIANKIQSIFCTERPYLQSTSLTGFLSGRRHYLCRAFPLRPASSGPTQSTLAILVERMASGSIVLSRIAEEFHLSRREQESVEFLMLGLSNKEIANRMKISPNTVRALLRMVMVKLGAYSRAGIVGRIIEREL